MSNITQTQNQIAGDVNKKIRALRELSAIGHKHFQSITPIKGGNARNKTVLRGNNIEADYAYATRLENGWSKQAPNGMFKPTVKFLDAVVKRIMGGR